VPQRALALSFAVIVCAGATQLLLGKKPAAGRTVPGSAALVATGLLIGVVCGLVSAGGAFMTVPFMLWCGVAMTTAIGHRCRARRAGGDRRHARLHVRRPAGRRSAGVLARLRQRACAAGHRRRQHPDRADGGARGASPAGRDLAPHLRLGLLYILAAKMAWTYF
jgi:hypothetical protein